MKNKILLSFLLSLLFCGNLLAQKKLIKKFLSEKADTSRKTSFIALPAAAYAQETGLEIGVLSITSFYTDKTDTVTRSSAINAIVTFTTKKQSNFVIKPDIWLPGNRYHFSGTFRYKNFPFDFYGIGDQTYQADKDHITQKLLVLSADAEKLIAKNIYAGISAGFEQYSYRDREPGGIFETGDFNDKDGGKVFYTGLSGIFDNRDVSTYTTRGNYLRLNFSVAPALIHDDFNGSRISADFRHFSRLAKKTVLGFNFNYQSVQGKNIPFYLLPQLGNDQVMRGYYTGRYRDQNLLTVHTELRWHPRTRFGAAVFAGTGTVFKNGDFNVRKLKPNYGAGLRYFLDPARGITLRMDYAVGEKRSNEPRQTGFYMALAEAF